MAEQQVLAALGQTAAVGTMHIDYRMSEAYGPDPPDFELLPGIGRHPGRRLPETGRYSSAADQAKVEPSASSSPIRAPRCAIVASSHRSR